MTTEVLRNMLYAGSQTLLGLGHVVMDEVHYLSDRFRGAVWEEVIIHLPASVTLVSLSATVSNAEEFGDWLDTVRGDTEVIVSEHRPVPLFQHVLAGRRMYDLFEEGRATRRPSTPIWRASPARRPPPSYMDRRRGRAMREADRERERRQRARCGLRADPRSSSASTPRACCRHHLHLQPGRLPGRRRAVPVRGLRLNNEEEREQVRALVEERTASIPPEDLHVLGYYEWLEGLERGIAAHHAACSRRSRKSSRNLRPRPGEGRVRHRALALGINMPARSVVLEKLVKWNGEQHADITPGEYTQLTGRAGRRGIDIEGHAVVLWQRGMNPSTSRASRARAPTRCAPASSRRTTWP